MARLAGRAGGDADQDAVAIDEDELLRDRDDDGNRTFRGAFRGPDELAGLETAEVAVKVQSPLGQRQRDGTAPDGEQPHAGAQKGDGRPSAEIRRIWRWHHFSPAYEAIDDPSGAKGLQDR